MTNKDNKSSDIIINGNTATWSIALTGDVNGLYTGTFKFRCFLTPLQVIAAGRERRELLGANPDDASELESFLAFSLTQLKQRVIEAPPFWTSTIQISGFAGDLPDENVVSAILDAAIEAELKYKEQLKHKKEETIKKAKELAEQLMKQQEKELTNEGKSKESND